MSQKIQVRRGTNTARQLVTLDVGEPAYAVDTKNFFIGDGITPGGVQVGSSLSAENESFVSIIPNSGSSATSNASGYMLALQKAVNKRPYNQPLSEFNRYSILLFPGKYDFSSFGDTPPPINPAKYIDTIGVGDRKNVILFNAAGFSISSGDCSIKNLSTICTGKVGVIPYCFSYTNNIINIALDNVYASGGNSVFPGGTFYSTTNAHHATGITVKNSVLVGGLFGNVYGSQAASIFDCSFENSVIDMRGANIGPFLGSNIVGSKNNLFDDCLFIIGNNDPFYSDSVNTYSFDKTNRFTRCVFSGVGINDGIFLDGDQAAIIPFQATIIDSIFYSSIYSFYGSMSNCTLYALGGGGIPINLNNSASPYPVFYNCTVIATGGPSVPSVTGIAGRSGLFSHCRFNHQVQSGITGVFGTQYNIVHSSFK